MFSLKFLLRERSLNRSIHGSSFDVWFLRPFAGFHWIRKLDSIITQVSLFGVEKKRCRPLKIPFGWKLSLINSRWGGGEIETEQGKSMSGRASGCLCAAADRRVGAEQPPNQTRGTTACWGKDVPRYDRIEKYSRPLYPYIILPVEGKFTSLLSAAIHGIIISNWEKPYTLIYSHRKKQRNLLTSIHQSFC